MCYASWSGAKSCPAGRLQRQRLAGGPGRRPCAGRRVGRLMPACYHTHPRSARGELCAALLRSLPAPQHLAAMRTGGPQRVTVMLIEPPLRAQLCSLLTVSLPRRSR